MSIALAVRLAVLVVVSAVGGMLAAWALGLTPGDKISATVEHCYISYDQQKQRQSRCQGSWTRGGGSYSGPINGVDVPKSWPLVSGVPSGSDDFEVVIPKSERRRAVLADKHQAWTLSHHALPWGFVPFTTAALLVTFTWSVTSAGRVRRLDKRAAPPVPEPVAAGSDRER